MEERLYKICGKTEDLDNLEKALRHIEFLGEIGASRNILIRVDGDGSGRINFKFDNEEDENMFKKIKSEMMSDYNKNKKDFEKFDFE